MRIGFWVALSGGLVSLAAAGCGQADESGVEDVSQLSEGLAACPPNETCVTKTLGNLTVRYYTGPWSASGQRQSEKCEVDSDFVLVGGGAEIDKDESPGALLTASYPEGDTWIARSKDHLTLYKHRVRAYAIGLRLAGLSKAALQKSVETTIHSTGPTAHPSIKFTPGAGKLILSGGAYARYGGAGQLLTRTTHSGSGWISASKDHVTSDPGYVDVFVTTILAQPIGSNIRLATDYPTSTGISSGGGYRSVTSISVDSSLVTGIGAADVGTNRLLTDAFPLSSASGGGTVRTKDHSTPASGNAELTLVRLHEL